MIEFGYALKRLDLLKKTVEQLIHRNQELVEANKKLRAQIETNLELYKADLRVKNKV